MQRLKFLVEQWAWFVVRRQMRRNRKFRISPSLSNRIGIVRFEFESNLEALQVPNFDALLLTVMGVRRSCVCVCPHDRTKTAETSHQIFHRDSLSRVLATYFTWRWLCCQREFVLCWVPASSCICSQLLIYSSLSFVTTFVCMCP